MVYFHETQPTTALRRPIYLYYDIKRVGRRVCPCYEIRVGVLVLFLVSA